VSRAAQALAAGVTMVQLRGHELSTARLYALARQLRPLCKEHGAIFVVNDRLDIGLVVQADGCQLGKQSLPLADARRVGGDTMLLGASIHSLEEARVASAAGADFLIVGTIFPSPSHPGESPAGPELLRAIKQDLPDCFVLAIGGITRETVGQAMAAGADGVAVISAVWTANDVGLAVRELWDVMVGG
jgi:thiamine-phosphate pyrophosphorylase